MDKPTIEIDSLAFSWPGRQGFGLTIPQWRVMRGDKVFLHGPSGSGKTTLLSLLGGVLLPQQGAMKILGQEMTLLSAAKRDRFRVDHLGFLFQQFNLLPYLSVMDNVLLPCMFSKIRRQRALTAADTLEQAACQLLSSLHLDPSLSGRPVTALSVGQQQRVAAARAMIGHPELIIADEPTSALDDDRQAVFLDLLLQQCADSGATLLFVSHNRSLAKHFTSNIAMSELCVFSTDYAGEPI